MNYEFPQVNEGDSLLVQEGDVLNSFDYLT